MNGFTEDKSKWNLGTCTDALMNMFSREGIQPGIRLDDEFANQFPDKYVCILKDFDYRGARDIAQVLGESKDPALVWDIQGGNTGLTEDQQEIASCIENVFFQNLKIYIIFKKYPATMSLTLRLKGA